MVWQKYLPHSPETRLLPFLGRVAGQRGVVSRPTFPSLPLRQLHPLLGSVSDRGISCSLPLDARRCISYLTIELRGSIPRKLRPLIGTWVFGCDICQEVCPWNRKVAPTQEEALKPRPWAAPDLLELVTLTEEEFRERFRQSPLRRAKRSGLVRNACVALGNLREPAAVPYLIRLLREDADPVVREHAAWALGRIATHEALKALRDALATETDDRVREEIRLSLQEATMPLPQPSPRDSDPCFLPERS